MCAYIYAEGFEKGQGKKLELQSKLLYARCI